MRFKKYLLENDPIEELIELVTSDYSEAFNLKTPIYRGTKIKNVYEIKKSSRFKTPRNEKALKPLTFHTMTLVCPNWKKFPDRSKSLFMTFDLDETRVFSSSYVRVFPKNNSELGLSPTDFNYYENWPMVQNLKLKISTFTTNFQKYFIPQLYILAGFSMNEMIKTIGYSSQAISWFNENYKTLFAIFKNSYKGEDILKIYNDLINKKLKKPYDVIDYFHLDDYSHPDDRMLLSILQKQYNGDLEKMLGDLFDPDKNNFKVINVKDVDKFKNERGEMWTSDDCLLMEEHTVELLKRKLRNKDE